MRPFVTTDDVLTHMNEAHPSVPLADFSETQKGQPCLLHEGHVYRYHREGKNNTHSWRCSLRHCCSIARTRGATRLDVTSVVISVSEHNHPGRSDVEMRLFCAIARMRKLADQSRLPSLEVRQKIFATLDPEVAAIFPSPKNVVQLLGHRRRKNAKAAKQCAS